MCNKFRKNKLAQTGDTITWLVATVVIMVILGISIFATSLAFKKDEGVKTIKKTDVLVAKSLFSYVLTQDGDGKIIVEQIKEENNLNEFNGNLGLKIFEAFYKEEYKKIWLGTISNKEGQQGLSLQNNYFGKGTFGVKEQFEVTGISETIKLDEEDSITLRLVEK